MLTKGFPSLGCTRSPDILLLHRVPMGGCPSSPGAGWGNLGQDVLEKGFLIPSLPRSSQPGALEQWLGAGCVRASPKRWHRAGTEPWHLPALPFTPSWHHLHCLRGPLGISSDPPSPVPAGTAATRLAGVRPCPIPLLRAGTVGDRAVPSPSPSPWGAAWVSSRRPALFLTHPAKSGRGKPWPLPKSGVRGCRWGQRRCHVRNGACLVFIACHGCHEANKRGEKGVVLVFFVFIFFQIFLL